MTYYDHVRREIQPLLPESVSRVLDIGAGSGATLQWLKTIFPRAETTGVEVNAGLHDKLKQRADVAIISDVNSCFSQLGTYDLILLLDVLEHLVDSAGTLKRISSYLSPGGSVIVSVPNIAHFSVSIPLLLKRQFPYSDAGILDSTHLRFFVEESAVGLLNSSNLLVTKGIASGLSGPKSNLIDHISLGLLRHHLTKQYIMLGKSNTGSVVQKRVHWITR
jgi:SAM-dependent methyltransferase